MLGHLSSYLVCMHVMIVNHMCSVIVDDMHAIRLDDIPAVDVKDMFKMLLISMEHFVL